MRRWEVSARRWRGRRGWLAKVWQGRWRRQWCWGQLGQSIRHSGSPMLQVENRGLHSQAAIVKVVYGMELTNI